MGKACSRFDKKEEDYCLEILMLGLNGAGKTTILNYLDGNSDEIPAPTITPVSYTHLTLPTKRIV